MKYSLMKEYEYHRAMVDDLITRWSARGIGLVSIGMGKRVDASVREMEMAKARMEAATW